MTQLPTTPTVHTGSNPLTPPLNPHPTYSLLMQSIPRHLLDHRIRPAIPDDLRGLVGLFRNAESVRPKEDIALLSAHFGDGSHNIFVAERQGEIVGAISAGQYGVRGVIYTPLTIRDEQPVAESLICAALAGLKSSGIQRVHLLTTGVSAELTALFQAAGFLPAHGETLMQRHLMGSQARCEPRPVRGMDVTVRIGNELDLDPLFKAAGPVNEIAFKCWEREILQRWAKWPDCGLLLVAADSTGALVGIVIAGVCGARGTVNHIWVADSARKQGLGQHLADRAMNYFVDTKAQVLHVMITEGNAVAERFWRAQGFEVEQGSGFLERDL